MSYDFNFEINWKDENFTYIKFLGSGEEGCTFLYRDSKGSRYAFKIIYNIEDDIYDINKKILHLDLIGEYLASKTLRGDNCKDNIQCFLDTIIAYPNTDRWKICYNLLFSLGKAIVRNITSDIEEIEKRVFLIYISKYIEGETLLSLIKGKLSDDCVSQIISTIFDSIKTLHNMSIVHNDLHLNNIIVNDCIPTIIDFGFADIKVNDEAKIIDYTFFGRTLKKLYKYHIIKDGSIDYMKMYVCISKNPKILNIDFNNNEQVINLYHHLSKS